jgi:hypothetical protein
VGCIKISSIIVLTEAIFPAGLTYGENIFLGGVCAPPSRLRHPITMLQLRRQHFGPLCSLKKQLCLQCFYHD